MNKTARAALLGRLARPLVRYMQLMRGGDPSRMQNYITVRDAISNALRAAKGDTGRRIEWPAWKRLYGIGESGPGMTYNSESARADIIRNLKAMRKRLELEMGTPGDRPSDIPLLNTEDLDSMTRRVWPFGPASQGTYRFSPDEKAELAASRLVRLLTRVGQGSAAAAGGAYGMYRLMANDPGASLPDPRPQYVPPSAFKKQSECAGGLRKKAGLMDMLAMLQPLAARVSAYASGHPLTSMGAGFGAGMSIPLMAYTAYKATRSHWAPRTRSRKYTDPDADDDK